MPAKRLPWFRFWSGATAHGKVRTLDDGCFRTWVELLDAASQQPHRGRFSSASEAAAITRRPIKHVRYLQTVGLVDIEGEGLVMHDWDEWQRWRKGDAIDDGTTAEQLLNDPRTTAEEPPNNSTPLREKREERVKSTTHPTRPSGGDVLAMSQIAIGFARLEVPDGAALAHDAVVAHLAGLGFDVEREYPVPDRGDGRPGAVDVMGRRADGALAIEIDRLSPRAKSAFKLGQCDATLRVVLLRGGSWQGDPPQGADMVVVMSGPTQSRARTRPPREPLTAEQRERIVADFAEKLGGAEEAAAEVDAAMNHEARFKSINEALYVRRWLGKEATRRPIPLPANGRASFQPIEARVWRPVTAEDR